jgi:hypothetical protein
MPAPLRRVTSDSPPDSPAAFHAPLFGELMTEFDESRRRVVLDLGAASTPILAFLGRARCRVEVADIAHFGGIETLNAAESGKELASVANSLFPNRLSNEPYDLVLCWDLLNYLTLNSLAALTNEIAARARPGALVHALIYYADREMPKYPGHFVPTNDAGLIDRATVREAIPAPRYSPEDLGKSMKFCTIDRARLLSNGLQEFLFQLEA